MTVENSSISGKSVSFIVAVVTSFEKRSSGSSSRCLILLHHFVCSWVTAVSINVFTKIILCLKMIHCFVAILKMSGMFEKK